MVLSSDALQHFDAGRHVVPCNGKKPVGHAWQTAWRDRDKLARYFEANPDANLGLVEDGQLIDIEWDNEHEAKAFDELFDGVDIPRTPCFQSTRGQHTFFLADPRLVALGRGKVHYNKLAVMIGAGKAVQTVIPPSINADGSQRVWDVSFDDCEPAELPAIVVDRILAAMAKPDVKPIPTGDVSPSIARAVVAMRGKKMEDHGDGSKRLFAYACSAVEHDLTDADAITAIRRAAETKPFPSDWTDGDILVRVRDAERDTKRGLANSSLMTPDGRTDAANGRRFAGRFAESAYFCSLQSKWLVWDQNRWSDDARLLIESYAKKCAHEMWAEIGEHE